MSVRTTIFNNINQQLFTFQTDDNYIIRPVRTGQEAKTNLRSSGKNSVIEMHSLEVAALGDMTIQSLNADLGTITSDITQSDALDDLSVSNTDSVISENSDRADIMESIITEGHVSSDIVVLEVLSVNNEVEASSADSNILSTSIDFSEIRGELSGNNVTGQNTNSNDRQADGNDSSVEDMDGQSADLGQETVSVNVSNGLNSDIQDGADIVASTEIVVSNQSELLLALQNVTGGMTIILEGGDYGDVSLNNLDFNLGITLKSADSDNPAEFNTLKIVNSSNITVDGVTVDLDVTENTLPHSDVLAIYQSSYINVINSTITGGMAVNGNSVDSNELHSSGNVLGLATSTPLKVFDSNNINIDNNDISEGRRGVVFDNVEELQFTDNNVHDNRGTPATGANVSNSVFDGNIFSDSMPWYGPNPTVGDHVRMFGLWTSSATPGYQSVNLTVTNNIFMQGEGGPSYMFFEDNSGGGYENFVFDNNIVHNSQNMGLLVENADGLTITNNTMLQSSLDPDSEGVLGLLPAPPSIIIPVDNQNVIIENNITGGVQILNDNPEAANITEQNNLIVQSTDPSGENYTGDLFVNPINLIVTDISDLMALPESTIESTGLGSSLLYFDTTPDRAIGFITDSGGAGIKMLTHYFDADNLYGPDGIKDISGSTVVWDFGDGNTATGLNVTYSYESAGIYDVVATITTPEGYIYTLEKTTEIETPFAINSDFEEGIIDNTDTVNEITTVGDITLEQTEYGQSLRIGDDASYITYASNNEIQGNAEFTVSASFQKNVASDSGRLLYFSGSAVITVGENSLSFIGSTDQGEFIQLTALNLDLNNLDWHYISYSFSQLDGTATLYLDGVQVAQQTGLLGAQPEGSAGMSIGSLFGDSLNALVDNVEFIRGAYNDDQMAENYNAIALEPGGSGVSNDGDHLYGDAGDNILVIDESTSTINGGLGQDTLLWSSGGPLELALSGISELSGIEKIDMDNGIGNKLSIDSLSEILQSDDNLLVIEGDSSDTLTLNNDMNLQSQGLVTVNGNTYESFVSGDASILVDTDIATDFI